MNSLFPDQSDHPLFRYMDDAERDLVEAVARVVELQEGDLLIRAGESDTKLYTVEQGVLEILTPDRRAMVTVGPGDVLGEVSFLDDSPRSASVRAASPALLRCWDKVTVLNTLESEPRILAKFAVAMSQLLVERLRHTAKAGVLSQRH